MTGEVDELIIKNKIFNEKINDENVKFITEMIEKKEIEKRYLHLEENFKKFRKVMFEKELGDRKLISDLRKNLLAANQNLKMTEINKKVEFERKKVNYYVMEKLFNSGQIKFSNEVSYKMVKIKIDLITSFPFLHLIFYFSILYLRTRTTIIYSTFPLKNPSLFLFSMFHFFHFNSILK